MSDQKPLIQTTKLIDGFGNAVTAHHHGSAAIVELNEMDLQLAECIHRHFKGLLRQERKTIEGETNRNASIGIRRIFCEFFKCGNGMAAKRIIVSLEWVP